MENLFITVASHDMDDISKYPTFDGSFFADSSFLSAETEYLKNNNEIEAKKDAKMFDKMEKLLANATPQVWRQTTLPPPGPLKEGVTERGGVDQDMLSTLKDTLSKKDLKILYEAVVGRPMPEEEEEEECREDRHGTNIRANEASSREGDRESNAREIDSSRPVQQAFSVGSTPHSIKSNSNKSERKPATKETKLVSSSSIISKAQSQKSGGSSKSGLEKSKSTARSPISNLSKNTTIGKIIQNTFQTPLRMRSQSTSSISRKSLASSQNIPKAESSQDGSKAGNNHIEVSDLSDKLATWLDHRPSLNASSNDDESKKPMPAPEVTLISDELEDTVRVFETKTTSCDNESSNQDKNSVSSKKSCISRMSTPKVCPSVGSNQDKASVNSKKSSISRMSAPKVCPSVGSTQDKALVNSKKSNMSKMIKPKVCPSVGSTQDNASVNSKKSNISRMSTPKVCPSVGSTHDRASVNSKKSNNSGMSAPKVCPSVGSTQDKASVISKKSNDSRMSAPKVCRSVGSNKDKVSLNTLSNNPTPRGTQKDSRFDQNREFLDHDDESFVESQVMSGETNMFSCADTREGSSLPLAYYYMNMIEQSFFCASNNIDSNTVIEESNVLEMPEKNTELPERIDEFPEKITYSTKDDISLLSNPIKAKESATSMMRAETRSRSSKRSTRRIVADSTKSVKSIRSKSAKSMRGETRSRSSKRSTRPKVADSTKSVKSIRSKSAKSMRGETRSRSSKRSTRPKVADSSKSVKSIRSKSAKRSLMSSGRQEQATQSGETKTIPSASHRSRKDPPGARLNLDSPKEVMDRRRKSRMCVWKKTNTVLL